MLRRDRGARGGGVALLIKDNIPFTNHIVNTEIEAIAMKLYLENYQHTVCSIYLPPAKTYETEQIENLINQLGNHTLLLGDFNGHHPQWGSPTSDRRGDQICDIILNMSLEILNNTEPTCISTNGNLSHIDLSMCAQTDVHRYMWDTHAQLMGSDHFPIIIKDIIHEPLQTAIIPRYIIDKADWHKFQIELRLPQSYSSVDAGCEEVESAIKEAANKTIPMKNTKNKNPHRTKIWWTSDCRDAIKHYHAAEKKFIRNHTMDNLINLKKLQARKRYIVKNAKRNSFQQYVSCINSRTPAAEVFKKIKAIKGTQYTRKAIVLLRDNEVIHGEKQVSDILVSHFSSVSSLDHFEDEFVYNMVEAEIQDIDFKTNNEEDYNCNLTYEELELALEGSKDAFPGPDDIPYILLRKMSTANKKSLLKFYNFIWNSNSIPKQWKLAVLIPLLKPGKLASDMNSYRPIALTSCLCKIYEKIIVQRLNFYLEVNEVLKPYQSGFRKGHSTYDGLVRLENDIRESFIRDEYVIAVFLDIEKAFDSVWHHGLLRKIYEHGLRGHLPLFLKSFLANRKIKVRIGATYSKSASLACGVAQGSVVSPTLFSLMINDIFDRCPHNVQRSLFADDGAIWIRCAVLEDGQEIMQEAIDAIESWMEKWGLRVSTLKTNVMLFTRKRQQQLTLVMKGELLTMVKEYKFLGITFDCTLTWASHIRKMKEKCQTPLRLLKTITNNKLGADRKMLIRLYNMLIRSIVDYGSLIYGTAANTHLQTIDRIQYAGIRIAIGALKSTPIQLLEPEADIIPLKFRREILAIAYILRRSQEHPVSKLIEIFYHYEFYDIRPYPLPFSGRIKEILKKFNLENKIDDTIINKRYHMRLPIVVDTELHRYNKKELSPV